jgi:hypothetical protein
LESGANPETCRRTRTWPARGPRANTPARAQSMWGARHPLSGYLTARSQPSADRPDLRAQPTARHAHLAAQSGGSADCLNRRSITFRGQVGCPVTGGASAVASGCRCQNNDRSEQIPRITRCYADEPAANHSMKGLLRQSSGCGEPGPAGGTPGKACQVPPPRRRRLHLGWHPAPLRSCAGAWKASPPSTIPGRRAHQLGRPHHQRHVGRDAQLQLHPGVQTRRLPPARHSNSLVLPAMLAAAAPPGQAAAIGHQHNNRTD